MVERYSINFQIWQTYTDPEGPFVRYSDYATLEAQLAEAEGYLRNLLVGFVQEHFPVNTEWAPLEGNLMGMLTQMDNASTIAREYKAQLAALPKPDMVSMSEGTIHLDYEDDDARRDAYEWLERYAYSSAPEAQQDPHEVLHVYDGDGGVIIRENGNISTFGAQTPAVLAAFESADTPEAQQEPVVVWLYDWVDEAGITQPGISFTEVIKINEKPVTNSRRGYASIRPAGQAVTEAQQEPVAWTGSGSLEEAIRLAEVGEYLYNACAYSYGDGYTEPREYGIEWHWQQSKPHEFGQGQLLAASTKWHEEQAADGTITEASKLRAALASATHPAEQAVTEATHRHKKRGTEYMLIGIGKMQAEHWLDAHPPATVGIAVHGSVDMREVAIYRSVDDTGLWVRPREEFEDGRFEALKAAMEAGR